MCETWLKFDSEDEDEASYEAYIYKTEHGYTADWNHTAVGLASSVDFGTLEEAQAWLAENGFTVF